MSMTVVALPIIIAPLIVIMNDKRRLKTHTNHLVTNIAVVAIVLLSFGLPGFSDVFAVDHNRLRRHKHVAERQLTH